MSKIGLLQVVRRVAAMTSFALLAGVALGQNAEKQDSISSILEEVKKGNMPPKHFLESHPEAVLTEAQIGQISQWVESFKVKP